MIKKKKKNIYVYIYIYGPVRKLREAGLDNFAKGMDLGYGFQGPGMVLNKNTVKKH